jgi:hypothetical protein
MQFGLGNQVDLVDHGHVGIGDLFVRVASRLLRRVVFPDPRKPERTVTAIRVSLFCMGKDLFITSTCP